MKVLKKIILTIIIILIFLLLFGFFLLICTEYSPKERESLLVEGNSSKMLNLKEKVHLITYNLGYLSLDYTQDFFMDGGTNVMPKDSSNVKRNLEAIQNFIQVQNADIYFFQEVDTKSKRSYYINEYEGLKKDFPGTTSFAYMFHSLFIPYPILNPVGHVESGNMTLNKYPVTSATRIALPSAYCFPKRVVMYKNPILEERIKIENTDKELILYNVHLDAYGEDHGASKQLDILLQNMKTEVEKGNYVIAGGDFNQIFPDVDLNQFPSMDTKNFNPTQLSNDYLPNSWHFVTDTSKPTSRLLNKVYSGSYEDTQLYVIDGYIVGPNIEVTNVETIENNFTYSDHHPVSIEFFIK